MSKNISVIIPTYKRKFEFIKTSLYSALNQNMDNFEVILVDDNGKDSFIQFEISKEVEKLSSKFSNLIYLVNEKNIGGAESRNFGALSSDSKFIAFLDDDDYFLPNHLSKQISFMENHLVDFSFSNLIIKNSNNKTIDIRSYNNLTDFSSNNLLKFHLMHHITGTPTFIIKKSIFQQIGGFSNVKMGQEFYLVHKLILNNCKIGYYNDYNVVAIRHNQGGISFGKNKILGEKKLFEFKKQYFKNLKKKEVNYIKFRHNIVLTIAFIRDNKPLSALLLIVRVIVLSPFNLIGFIIFKLHSFYNYNNAS